MRTKLITILSALTIASVGVLAVGCDDGDDTDAGPGGNDAGPPDMVDAGPPDDDAGPGDVDAGPGAMPLGMANPPTPGTQIDRAGRPGITTALVGTFVTGDATPTVPTEAMRNTMKDDYNADDDPSTWAADYTDLIANNLAIIDAIDPTAPTLPDLRCGNQLLAGAAPTADRYDGLAGVLANDWLVVNTTTGDCSAGYLGAEAEVVGAVPAGMGGCGGRMPTFDVIDRTYSVLVDGTLSGIDDAITFAEEDGAHTDDTFPFLGPAL